MTDNTVSKVVDDPNAMFERTESLRQMLKIQGSKGNWDFSPYMMGMYNGMLLALWVLEGRDSTAENPSPQGPAFRKKPDTWIEDKINLEKDAITQQPKYPLGSGLDPKVP